MLCGSRADGFHEELTATATGLAAMMHGRVRILEQHLRIEAVVRKQADADARRYRQFCLANQKGSRQGGLEAPRHQRGCFGVRHTGQRERKFIATDPRQPVGGLVDIDLRGWPGPARDPDRAGNAASAPRYRRSGCPH